MIRSPGSVTWEGALGLALKGDPQLLLDLLLVPVRTDSRNQPLPDEDGQAFYPLPEDRALRERIVRTLMLLGSSTRKSGRPAVSEGEVAIAGLLLQIQRTQSQPGQTGGPDYDEVGAMIGLSGDRLRKRLQAQKRAKRARAKPGE